ncbi:MAG: UDP-glucose 4-epimerase GalE [Mycoplasmoidaceae bacterium]
MKILVTGGLGYIGSHAVNALIKKGYEVVVIDDLSQGNEANQVAKAKYYYFDIKDEKKLSKVFETEATIAAIMHFAGSISVEESVKDPEKYFQNNVHAFQTFLNTIAKYQIKNLIFSSTAAVYGEPKTVPILEDDDKAPVNPYGQTKLEGEKLLAAWANKGNANYVIFRYFNVAGADESKKLGIRTKKLTHLVPCVIQSVLDPSVIFKVFGTDYKTRDGSAIRDFVHVNDLVEAHILGLEWAIKNNQSNIFNLGSNHGYSVLEVLNEAQKVLATNIVYELKPRRAGDPAILTASNQKALAVLNWKPKYSLAEIIKTEYEFRKQLKN